MTKRNVILHPVFILSLLTLLVNDFCLKEAFSNQVTGKLSDFAGLIVFPVLMAYLFPFSKKWISVVSGMLFIIWKTPLVSPVINTLNQASLFSLHRTVDYSDYRALIVLVLAHHVINQDFTPVFRNNYFLKAGKFGVTVIGLFAICATSYIRPPEVPKGTIYIGKEYTVNKSKEETIEAIKSLGYNVDYFDNSGDSMHTESYRAWKTSYYQTDNIVIYNYDDDSMPVDTILNAKYTLSEPKKNKTTITLINVTLSEDGNIQEWQTLKYLSKQYNRILEKQIIKKIK